ncbi:MAG: hypothetical protein ABIH23_29070, partial [bacterium]
RARAGGAVAQYDIARLTLASRLVYLKTGESPKTMAALVPDYIPKRLKDPFAVEGWGIDTYRFDRRRNVLYSIGPDRTDDRNLISYAPSNGTMSTGDISPLYP